MTSVVRIDQLAIEEQARLQAVFERARAGDRTVLPELEHEMARHPELWERFGDLGLQARAAWVGLAAGQDLAFAEAVRRRMEALRTELAGPSPSRVERLLVDRVVACQLQVDHADAMAAQPAGLSPALYRLAMQRQDSAQRRLLAAIRELALVRRLVRPSPSPVDMALRPVAEEAPRGRVSLGRREEMSLVAAN
jgi:hypothetical protein